MATKNPDTEAAAPPKGKKKLMLMLAVVLVLVLVGGGGWIYMAKKNAAALEEDGEEEVAAASHGHEASGPPTYLPLDNMVVNLADPGGERVAQIGVTLELSDTAATDVVKGYLPSIRSEILMLVSQRTADELLKREGKEQLASDIMTEASKHFGKETPGKKDGKKKSKKAEPASPIRGVLFSSFIVQ